MKRRRIGILTVLSAVMSLAVAGAWVRSYWIVDRISGSLEWFESETLHPSVMIDSGEGEWFAVFRRVDLESIGSADAREQVRAGIPRTGLRWTTIPVIWDATDDQPGILGFWWDHWKLLGNPEEYWAIWVPYWAIMMLACVPWIRWGVGHWRRRRRRARGLCVECGYDLRATPERCPECGEEVGGKK